MKTKLVAAVQTSDGKTFIGTHHYDAAMKAVKTSQKYDPNVTLGKLIDAGLDEGFVLVKTGKYLTRWDAMQRYGVSDAGAC